MKFTIYGSLGTGWGGRVRDWFSPFFFTGPCWGPPWDSACLKGITLLFRPVACQVAFSGDGASDEEKIRKLPLIKSRSGRHFLLRLRDLEEKRDLIQTSPGARQGFEVRERRPTPGRAQMVACVPPPPRHGAAEAGRLCTVWAEVCGPGCSGWTGPSHRVATGHSTPILRGWCDSCSPELRGVVRCAACCSQTPSLTGETCGGRVWAVQSVPRWP